MKKTFFLSVLILVFNILILDMLFASFDPTTCSVLNGDGTVQCGLDAVTNEQLYFFQGACKTVAQINTTVSTCTTTPQSGRGGPNQLTKTFKAWNGGCAGSCSQTSGCDNSSGLASGQALFACNGTCVVTERMANAGMYGDITKDFSSCASRGSGLTQTSVSTCHGIVCIADKTDYLVKFSNSNGGQEPSAVFQDGSSLVMGGEIAADGSLLLDLNGSIGATEYCDAAGANCVLAADLGSGGGGNGGGDLDDLNNTDTSSCDVVGEVLTWTNNLNGDNTTGDNGWICSDQLAGNWTYTTNVSTDNTLTYDGGDTDMVVIDDASSAVDSNIELLVHGDISADRFCSGVDADTGNCLTIPDTACTGTDVLAWTDDANGDATTGDYGWSCQEVTTADGSLMALSDTNVTTCADGSALVYNSDWDNDNANSGDSDEKDDNEWRCQSANEPVWAGLTASTYNGNQAGYSGTKNICGSTNADYPGSHICSASEVTTLLSNGLSFPTATNNQFWVNNGAPGYVATPSNDCAGWTSDSSATYGSVLAKSPSGAVRFLISPCDNNNARQFACCF